MLPRCTCVCGASYDKKIRVGHSYSPWPFLSLGAAEAAKEPASPPSKSKSKMSDTPNMAAKSSVGAFAPVEDVMAPKVASSITDGMPSPVASNDCLGTSSSLVVGGASSGLTGVLPDVLRACRRGGLSFLAAYGESVMCGVAGCQGLGGRASWPVGGAGRFMRPLLAVVCGAVCDVTGVDGVEALLPRAMSPLTTACCCA